MDEKMKIKKIRLEKALITPQQKISVSMEAEIEPGENHGECLLELEQKINEAIWTEGTLELYPSGVSKVTKPQKAEPEETPVIENDEENDDF